MKTFLLFVTLVISFSILGWVNQTNEKVVLDKQPAGTNWHRVIRWL
jgi:hypothetical protein